MFIVVAEGFVHADLPAGGADRFTADDADGNGGPARVVLALDFILNPDDTAVWTVFNIFLDTFPAILAIGHFDQQDTALGTHFAGSLIFITAFLAFGH
jgi:hypothetical protein